MAGITWAGSMLAASRIAVRFALPYGWREAFQASHQADLSHASVSLQIRRSFGSASLFETATARDIVAGCGTLVTLVRFIFASCHSNWHCAMVRTRVYRGGQSSEDRCDQLVRLNWRSTKTRAAVRIGRAR